MGPPASSVLPVACVKLALCGAGVGCFPERLGPPNGPSSAHGQEITDAQPV